MDMSGGVTLEIFSTLHNNNYGNYHLKADSQCHVNESKPSY